MNRGSLKESGSVVLVSCYELGHQPLGLAMPKAFLEREGFHPKVLDVAAEGIQDDLLKGAGLVGISVPMHTALRLGVTTANRIRSINPDCHICFYGHYAVLNREYLLGGISDTVIGGEYEQPFLRLALKLESGNAEPVDGVSSPGRYQAPFLQRLDFPVPSRGGLLPLDRYSRLLSSGKEFLAGYVEASRGCKHLCSHCPIPPVYEGQFFAIPRDVVLEDVRQLVAAGARHITFGDPDFLNGPTHALKIVRRMSQEFPGLTFDFTAKIEHLLRHRRLLPEFEQAGCLFVVSAVESFSDEVLENLRKGHTREDVFEAWSIVEASGLTLRPSFVSFTPWTTLDDYLEVMDILEAEDRVDCVDAIQFAIRLLIPPGSHLLDNPGLRAHLGPLIPDSFSYEWTHPDPRMDELYIRVKELVEQSAGKEEGRESFANIRKVARAVDTRMSASEIPYFVPVVPRSSPRLTEPWFC